MIPLTSKKDHDPTWIEENKEAIVDLGIINGFPDETKECYACTFMIQSVSKNAFHDMEITKKDILILNFLIIK